MYCGYCGQKINENDKFCKYCGQKKEKREKQTIDLETFYINKNKDEFEIGKINVYSLLLGPFYLVYRKMYLYGFLWEILFLLINFLINPTVAFVFYIILSVYFGIQFNYLYKNKVKEEVTKIKQDCSNDEVLNICKKNGGISSTALIISIVIFVFSLIIYDIYYRTTYSPNHDDYEYDYYDDEWYTEWN